LRLGCLWGVSVHLNPWFLGLLGLYFVAGLLDRGLVAFGLVLCHELAHVAAARTLGCPAYEVELLPFGGVVRMGTEVFLEPGREIRVALAGPAANLALFGLGLGLYAHGLWEGQLHSFFLQTNLLLLGFNLLPALPLDGGRMARAWLATRRGYLRASLWLTRSGQVGGLLMVAGGVAGFVCGRNGLDIMITGLFLAYAATRERAQVPYLYVRYLAAKNREVLAGKVLRASTLAVLENVPLRRLAAHLRPGTFCLVWVLSPDLELRGIVSEGRVVEALFHRGGHTKVGELLS